MYFKCTFFVDIFTWEDVEINLKKSSGKAFSNRNAETCVKHTLCRLMFDHDPLEKSCASKGGGGVQIGIKKNFKQQKGSGNMWVKIGRFFKYFLC